jgi:exopolysaccharide production protein ExoQ
MLGLDGEGPMDRRVAKQNLDPALAVSGLLTRLGLFLLVVFAPFIAMFSRRTVAILIPIATALLILAAALDGHLAQPVRRLGSMLLTRQAVTLFLLIVWAALTLLWTPRPGDAAARLAEGTLVALLFAGAIACMRDRTRRSDVNLIPIGTAIAAFTLLIECFPNSPLQNLTSPHENRAETQRAAVLLALLAWPAVASLTVQSRRLFAALLALLVLIALWFTRDLVVLAAFLAGAVTFLLGIVRPRTGTVAVGGATLAMLIFAPLIGWLMAKYGGFLLPRAGDELVGVWRDVTFSLPSRLVQGFGFNASTALERGVGGVILGSPRNAALQIWLELGIVGVLLAAAALYFSVFAVERVDDKARAAVLAVFAAAAVIMFAGPASWQNWWITAIGLTAITLAFLSRRASRRS